MLLSCLCRRRVGVGEGVTELGDGIMQASRSRLPGEDSRRTFTNRSPADVQKAAAGWLPRTRHHSAIDIVTYPKSQSAGPALFS